MRPAKPNLHDGVCGNCTSGYVSFDGVHEGDDINCVSIDDVTWDDYARRYEPFYHEDDGDVFDIDLYPSKNEERLGWLRRTLRVISSHMSRPEELDFTLRPNKYSADTEADYGRLTGYRFEEGAVDLLPRFDKRTLVDLATRRSLQQDDGGELPREVDWVAMGGVTDGKFRAGWRGLQTLGAEVGWAHNLLG